MKFPSAIWTPGNILFDDCLWRMSSSFWVKLTEAIFSCFFASSSIFWISSSFSSSSSSFHLSAFIFFFSGFSSSRFSFWDEIWLKMFCSSDSSSFWFKIFSIEIEGETFLISLIELQFEWYSLFLIFTTGFKGTIGFIFSLIDLKSSSFILIFFPIFSAFSVISVIASSLLFNFATRRAKVECPVEFKTSIFSSTLFK